jgi:hypothetical protein
MYLTKNPMKSRKPVVSDYFGMIKLSIFFPFYFIVCGGFVERLIRVKQQAFVADYAYVKRKPC